MEEPLLKCPTCKKPTRIDSYGASDQGGLYARLSCGCKTYDEAWIERSLSRMDAWQVQERRIHAEHIRKIGNCPCGPYREKGTIE